MSIFNALSKQYEKLGVDSQKRFNDEVKKLMNHLQHVDNFFNALTKGRIEIVERMLLQNLVNVNIEHGLECPLTLAVKSGNVYLVEMLLKQGADPNGSTTNVKLKGKPLILAVEMNQRSVVETLLEFGANVNTINETPMSHRNHEYACFNALIVAISINDLEMAKLLLDHGADVNAKLYHGNKFRTILEIACQLGLANLELVDLLIKEGAEINLQALAHHRDFGVFVGQIFSSTLKENFIEMIAKGQIQGNTGTKYYKHLIYLEQIVSTANRIGPNYLHAAETIVDLMIRFLDPIKVEEIRGNILTNCFRELQKVTMKMHLEMEISCRQVEVKLCQSPTKELFALLTCIVKLTRQPLEKLEENLIEMEQSPWGLKIVNKCDDCGCFHFNLTELEQNWGYLSPVVAHFLNNIPTSTGIKINPVCHQRGGKLKKSEQ